MVTPAERTLALLEDLARSGATTFAVGRLLQRRPDLAAPAGLPVVVPRDEDAAFRLDKLAFLAWAVRQLDVHAQVEASGAQRAGASWAQLATATRSSPEEARARYGYLAPRPPGGERR
ncbi:MAG TPA: hypothetical protein VIM97_10995 [Actinomycetes bacterium]